MFECLGWILSNTKYHFPKDFWILFLNLPLWKIHIIINKLVLTNALLIKFWIVVVFFTIVKFFKAINYCCLFLCTKSLLYVDNRRGLPKLSTKKWGSSVENVENPWSRLLINEIFRNVQCVYLQYFFLRPREVSCFDSSADFKAILKIWQSIKLTHLALMMALQNWNSTNIKY